MGVLHSEWKWAKLFDKDCDETQDFETWRCKRSQERIEAKYRKKGLID